MANESLNVVFLDADTLGPDLDFNKFTSQWNVMFFPQTTSDQIAERIKNQHVVIANKFKMDKGVLSLPEAKDIKLICVAATGVNNIDLEFARSKNIGVTNVPGYSTDSVAQHTFALLLELCSRAGRFEQDVRSGDWEKSHIFTMYNWPTFELRGKKIGIVGHGTIGTSVAQIAKGFGMEVLVSERPGSTNSTEGRVPFQEVLQTADVVSLHCPLTESTEGFINTSVLQKMKPSSYLINTARGGLIVEDDLISALKNKTITGAGLDVVSIEPPPKNLPIIQAAKELDNLVITPHSAWITIETRTRLIHEVAANIESYFSDQDRNRLA